MHMTGNDLMTVFLPFIFGSAVASALYLGIRGLNRLLSRNAGARRIAIMAETEERRQQPPFASSEHKLQLVLLQLGIQPRKDAQSILWALRIVLAAPIFIVLNFFLFDNWFLNLAVALFGSHTILNTLIAMRWMKTVEQLEDDILTFNASIRNTFKVIPDVASAVAFECEIFEVGSPLRQWLEQEFLAAVKSSTGLSSSFQQLKADAYTISRSLYNCVVLLENVGETGGNQLDEAYLQTEDDLNIKARVRDQVQQVVSGTRSQKLILIAITIALMVGLGRSDIIQASGFVVRILYILILGMMAVGWNVITEMVERTLR